MSLHVPSDSSTNVPHSIFRAWLSSSSDSGRFDSSRHVSLFNLLNLLYKALVRLSCSDQFVGEVEELGHNTFQVLEHRLLQVRAKGFLRDFLGCLVRRLLRGLSVSRLLSPPRKFPATRAPTRMAAARAIPTGLKSWISSPPTLRTDMETTATNDCAEVVKVEDVCTFLAQLICCYLEPGPRADRSESRERRKTDKSKNHQQNQLNSWSETHVQVCGDVTRKELSRENKLKNHPKLHAI